MSEISADVVVVGCGPAGIFTALELSSRSKLRVVMVDKGPELEKRRCFSRMGYNCANCNPCTMLCGWGGAGAFSDGKLTLSTDVGGWLEEYVGREELNKLIDYVDKVYLKFGAPTELYGTDVDVVEKLQREAQLAGLKLVPVKVRHLGTEKCFEVIRNMREALRSKVKVLTERHVQRVLVDGGSAKGVELIDGTKIEARYVVLAPGRSGAEWLKRITRELGLKTINNPVDIGVRVEVPAPVMEPLTKYLYEPKLIYYSKAFDDQVRTFCFNPYGEVITESYEGVLTVNGHSFLNKKTGNTNFAILVSTSFTEPFKEPIAYGKYIAHLANLLGGGIIIQRLGDLEEGRRSTPDRIKRNIVEPTLKTATPGDLSFVLPYRYLANILEMLKAMDGLTPGVYSRHTLLYGVEVKFYSSRIELSKNLETKVENLYAAGDGAGVTRGLIQASASGVIVARDILQKEGVELELNVENLPIKTPFKV
ncbi:MAG: FAD-dependent oxidoreductase [Thermoprotei archaeon]|nr:MAG: FAD-dependent oxidoreductase [Thermoprotei archaeon]